MELAEFRGGTGQIPEWNWPISRMELAKFHPPKLKKGACFRGVELGEFPNGTGTIPEWNWAYRNKGLQGAGALKEGREYKVPNLRDYKVPTLRDYKVPTLRDYKVPTWAYRGRVTQYNCNYIAIS
jgi:hypothetical protein